MNDMSRKRAERLRRQMNEQPGHAPAPLLVRDAIELIDAWIALDDIDQRVARVIDRVARVMSP